MHRRSSTIRTAVVIVVSLLALSGIVVAAGVPSTAPSIFGDARAAGSPATRSTTREVGSNASGSELEKTTATAPAGPTVRRATPVPATAPTALASSIVYVCDGSGSMMGLPMDLLKIELHTAVEALSPTQKFNVMFFRKAGVTALWPDGLMPASPRNKQAFAGWLRDVQVLSSSDPIPALKLAFRQRPQVIYLLTDGAFENNDEIVRVVGQLNADRRTRVHTIAFFSDGVSAVEREACEEVLRRIADDTGGRLRIVQTSDLDRNRRLTGAR